MNVRIESAPTHRRAWASLALALAALPFLTTSAAAADMQKLKGHVPSAIAHLTPVGPLPATQRLNLAIGLPLRNREALTNLLQDLYNPASPRFRKYLTPAQFAEQFGPSEGDYQAVIAFARANNLNVTVKHPNRVLLDVNASVTDIEKALHITMRVYQHPKEHRTFYAPDGDPLLDLATPILAVRGLNTYQLPHPNYRIASATNSPNGLTPNAGSGPSGSYMGRDFTAAYVPGTLLTGAGQTVGLLQFDGYYTNDIAAYAAQAGLPYPNLENVYLDGYNGAPGPNDLEVCLDIDMVMSMAPGAAKIILYEGGPFGIPDDILNAMATENRAKQLSASWIWGGGPSILTDQIFQQMIAQGQSFFHGSGDNDAYPPGVVDDPVGPFAPSSNPYITQVGGTTLTTAGPEGAWVSERVWNSGGGSGSGGGISSFYPIPPWQQGIDMTANQGSTTFRNIPDVAMVADNVYVISDNGIQYPGVSGTSCATPLWAGLTALMNQQAAVGGFPPVGFINPAVYAIGKGANYTACFHDTTTGDNTWSGSPNLFFAVPGYDLCTGWGTPTGTNLINALVTPVAAPSLIVVSNVVFGGNGNGLIDFNECNSLNLVLGNIGTIGATGIKATLSTTNSGVAIGQAISAYPNIPAGSWGTNLVPFKISTAPDFIVGTPVNLLLLLEYDQGVGAQEFTLPSGVVGSPLRFDNNNAVIIPSPGTINSGVAVSNLNFAINKVTVSVFAVENIDYYLSLDLIAPDGTICNLTANNGLGGQNYGLSCSSDAQRTTFDDAASTPISFGVAPFVGTFIPSQPLAVFTGKSGTNVNGVWQLRATDQGRFDTASLQCWTLFITPTLSTDGGGQCPGADMALGITATPAAVIAGNNLTYHIAVTNLGPSAAANVNVTHLLPPNVTFVSATTSQGTYSQQGGVVTFSLGPMVPRAPASISVIVQPTDLGTNYVIYSTATVSSEQPDFVPGNNSATVKTQVTPGMADVAVGIAAVPNPALVSGTLTYTVSLINNGPGSASSVMVTNALPASVQIQSVTVSRGSTTTLGNVILWSIPGKLSIGATATATITVTPTVQGVITAVVTAGAHEFDPILANNQASVSTTIGPAADLALSITDYPDPVVAGSNMTYTVVVTNKGPSTATSIIVNETLPSPVNVLSTNTTQGTISIVSGSLIWNIGSLSAGASATLTLGVQTVTNGTLTTTASVIATEPDPQPANNSATAVTTVAAPFVSIVASGATLTYESGPVNGAIDNGETVTVILRLLNTGNAPTVDLVGTLLPTNGVAPVPPNTPQHYRLLPPSGSSVGRSFSFTASGTNGQTIYAVLQLQDGATTYPPVNFGFTLPNTQVFANTNAITIPDPAAQNPPYSYPPQAGFAKPYPSVINVPSYSGTIGRVSITLSNFNHSYPGDVNVLLVAPGGANALLLSHAGDQNQATAGLNLTFDDTAASPLPSTGVLYSGVWQSSVFNPPIQLGGFPANAPAGPYPTSLNAFNSVNAVGNWSLYVFDDSAGDSGAISNGWSLALTKITPVNQMADLGVTGVASPNPVRVGLMVTNVFTVTNAGPNDATSVAFTNGFPGGLTLISAGASQGAVTTTSNSVTAALGVLSAGATATITNVMMVTGAALSAALTNAPLTNTASVSADEIDLNLVNNTASVVITAIRPVAALGIALGVTPGQVAVGYPLTNTIVVTNQGPDFALNTIFLEPLPPGVGFIASSSSSTVGTLTNIGGTVTCVLGDLAPTASPMFVIVTTNATAGAVNGQVALHTDSYPALYSTNYVATVTNQAPQIINAGAVLTSESGPVNGVIDAGETVTLKILLANIGTLDTVNLKATLLPTGNVTTNITGPQSRFYGALVAGGPSVAQSFTFKAASPLVGGAVVVSLQLQDVTAVNPSVVVPFPGPGATNVANTAAITIPDHGPGTPYPAIINVSGLTGRVTKATVTLNGFAHQFPHDVDILLVSPSGSNVLVMSHTGGGYATNNLMLTFDDAAATSLPNYNPLASGTYRPSSYQGPVALPGTVASKDYQYDLSAMKWSNPNGPWLLYVFDDTVGDDGVIAGGWSLGLTTAATVGPVVTLPVSLSAPASLNAGGYLTNAITINNFGPDTASGVVLALTNPPGAGVSFSSASLSQGTVTSTGDGFVICNLGNIPALSSATATIVTIPSHAGTITSTATVVANEENLTNNAAQATTTVSGSGATTLSGAFIGGHFQLTVTGPANYSYVVLGSSNLTSWVSLSTNTNTTGTFTYTDPTTPVPQSRYYRTLRQ